ncbi:ATP-binding protein [Streptomyces sp. NPDC057743]|uniref:ATP-binding protein n=1 Tax=Streptomyces sp. NPDC057743 TaxID=3346236 RepID=UPI003676A7A5
MTTVDERSAPPAHRPVRESYRFSVPSTATAPRVAREMVANLLVLLGHEGASEVARLLVSELVTNAHAHTDTRVIHLDVVVGPGRVVVAVWDAGPARRPEMRAADGEDETGRGLRLVDALAAGWGVGWPAEPTDPVDHIAPTAPAGWKRVWFALAADGAAGRSAAALATGPGAGGDGPSGRRPAG